MSSMGMFGDAPMNRHALHALPVSVVAMAGLLSIGCSSVTARNVVSQKARVRDFNGQGQDQQGQERGATSPQQQNLLGEYGAQSGTGTGSEQRRLPPPLDKDIADIRFAPLEFSPREPGVKHLTNGLAVYLMPDHELPLVDVSAVIEAGTAHDPADKVGLAQLLGSTLKAGGAGERDGAALDEALESRAATLSVSTNLDLTFVHLSALSEDTEFGLDVVADVLRRPRFDADRVDIESARLIEAVRRRNDEPDSIAFRELRQAMYGEDSPWARLPKQADLNSIDIDDLRRFHSQMFRPDKTTLIVVGAFDADRMLRELEQRFGDWESIPDSRSRKSVPKASPRPTTRNFAAKKQDQAVVVIGAPFMERRNPDQVAAEVLNHLLGGSALDSRLGQAIRSDRGLAYSVYSGFNFIGDSAGYFYIYAGTKAENAQQVLEIMREELERIVEEGVTEEELQRAKDSFLNRHVFRFENPARIAIERAVHDIRGYPPDYITTYPNRVQKVTTADLSRVARRYLKPERFTAVVVGPPIAIGEKSPPPKTSKVPAASKDFHSPSGSPSTDKEQSSSMSTAVVKPDVDASKKTSSATTDTSETDSGGSAILKTWRRLDISADIQC